MGVDIGGIIEHKLSPKQFIVLNRTNFPIKPKAIIEIRSPKYLRKIKAIDTL